MSENSLSTLSTQGYLNYDSGDLTEYMRARRRKFRRSEMVAYCSSVPCERTAGRASDSRYGAIKRKAVYPQTECHDCGAVLFWKDREAWVKGVRHNFYSKGEK